MSITVYGLRLRGETEVRYVGQTADKEQRLLGHLSYAHNMPWPTDFALWLREHAAEIEMVDLGFAETRVEARQIERAAVGFCLALGFQLFNQWLVPPARRCASRTSPRPERRRPVAA